MADIFPLSKIPPRGQVVDEITWTNGSNADRNNWLIEGVKRLQSVARLGMPISQNEADFLKRYSAFTDIVFDWNWLNSVTATARELPQAISEEVQQTIAGTSTVGNFFSNLSNYTKWIVVGLVAFSIIYLLSFIPKKG